MSLPELVDVAPESAPARIMRRKIVVCENCGGYKWKLTERKFYSEQYPPWSENEAQKIIVGCRYIYTCQVCGAAHSLDHGNTW